MSDQSTITVVQPGLLTTVQDAGRAGNYHLGIPPSGAMDQQAFRTANLLVGNPETSAVLETALAGPQLQFSADTVVAVTGAQMGFTLDGEPVPNYTSVPVRAGQTLTGSFATAGLRGYVAIAGGIAVPEVLGSRSTYRLGALGGLEGRSLAAGDVLPIGDETTGSATTGVSIPEELRSRVANEFELRVIRGLYDHLVTDEALNQFFADQWEVASESDRVGYRFGGGTPLEFNPRTPPFGAGSDPSNIVDAPYPIGSIQVPSGAQPIVLHRDAVSAGGYMTLGAVISADMDLMAQMAPRTTVRFVEVTMTEALDARRSYRDRMAAIRDATTSAHRHANRAQERKY